jgi:hypothetical protein
MNLELAIMKGQESAKKVARELKVNFDENGGTVTPAIRRMRTCNTSVSSTRPIPVSPGSVINSNQELVVAPSEVITGEKTSPVDEMMATENHAFAPPPLNSSYNGGSSRDHRNSGPNRANDGNGNAFANNASDRWQSQFSGEQHQDRRTDPVKLAMAMSARFSSKDHKSQFSGGSKKNILDYIQECKLAICEYDLSPSMQKDFFCKLFRTSSEPLSFYRNKANDVFSFDDAVNIMVKRHKTPELQARVHTYLKTFRFTSFRFDEKLDASSTLTALTSEISKLSPMGPPQYQGGVHAVEHLRNAVLGKTCANDVLRATNPQTISFSNFGTNRHRALLLRDELNAIAATHNWGH